MPPSSNSEPDAARLTDALALVDQRARLTQNALKVFLGVMGVALVSHVLQLDLLLDVQHGAFVDEARATANDTREGFMLILKLVALLASAVVVLRWKWAAYRLMPHLTGHPTEHAAGWAAGAYFVPILNLFRPYQIMREMWEESTPAHEVMRLDVESRSSGLIGLWWALWLVGSIGERILFRIARDVQSVEGWLTVTELMIGLVILAAASALVLLLIVRHLNDQQQAKGREVMAGATQDPLATLAVGAI